VQLLSHHSQNLQRQQARQLLSRLFGPLCGIDQMVGLSNRSATEPRIFVLSAEMTGVHLLLERPQPTPNTYHIGGAGICLEEAMIKTLAETIERYCQMLAYASGQHVARFRSYHSMLADGCKVVDPRKLTFFTAEQLHGAGFPFARFDPDMPLDWVQARSLLRDNDTIWFPSQLAFLGYNLKPPEKRLSSAVTTGTAAHTDRRRAARNAILELVQLDTAMGFWFSKQAAAEIVLGERTRAIGDLIAEQFHPAAPKPRVFWLRNPDLPVFTIACLAGSGSGAIPASAVGLGSDLKLQEAIYKAVLEAVAVSYLAKIVALQQSISAPDQPDEAGLSDLDANIAFYARLENQQKIDAKFGSIAAVADADLPADFEGNIGDELAHLAGAFALSGKELLFLDITTGDAAALGFHVARVWSPDLLTLSLPNFPPGSHPRFNAYGGFQDASPHPYP
jgi:thiazole/oxazole-forming peptide maturase SagD family component